MIKSLAITLTSLLITSFSFAAPLTEIEKKFMTSWYNPSTSGQGALFDIIETTTSKNIFFGSWYTYNNVDATHPGKLWFTLQGETNPNSTTQNVKIYLVENHGRFNQNNPPQPHEIGKSIEVGTLTLTLQANGQLKFDFNFHQNDPRWDKQGSILLSRVSQENPVYTPIEKAFKGTWYEQAKSGQGFQFDLIEVGGNNKVFFGAWYTYTADASDKLWLTLQGDMDKHATVQTVDIILSKDGDFNNGKTTSEKVGEAILTLQSSNKIKFEFVFDNPNDPRWNVASGVTNIVKTNLVPTSAIDTLDKQAVTNAYRTIFKKPAPNVNWTGSVSGCVPGQISQDFINYTIDMVNYHRAMAQLKPVALASEDQGEQSAALMIKANSRADHYPPPSSVCYTPAGADASLKGVLQFGTIPLSVVGFISSPGHRRWLFDARAKQMSVGGTDISGVIGVQRDLSGNINDFKDFIAWPSPGYFPYGLWYYAYPEWTFSLPGANFDETEVSMKNVTTNSIYSVVVSDHVFTGVGSNSLVFYPEDFNYRATNEQVIEVSLRNVKVNGVLKNYTYTVITYNAN